MSEKDPDESLDEDEGEEGEGAGSLGAPKLKPNLEQLMDPDAASESRVSKDSAGDPLPDPDAFGDWRYRHEQLMLYNNKLRKKLMLTDMDSPGKLLKVIVGLGTQAGWDTENLVKGLDHAAQRRFGKSLYQVIAPARDSLTLDWKTGTLNTHAQSAPASGHKPLGPGGHAGGGP